MCEAQGRHEEAESLYQQALEIQRSLLGDQHPNIANSLNNLAFLYYDQGRYKKAEPFHSEHPLTQDVLAQLQQR